jgi:hypothetical protein
MLNKDKQKSRRHRWFIVWLLVAPYERKLMRPRAFSSHVLGLVRIAAFAHIMDRLRDRSSGPFQKGN